MECGSWWSAALQQLHHALLPALECLGAPHSSWGCDMGGNEAERGAGLPGEARGAGHVLGELMEGQGLRWSHDAHGEPR